MFSGGPYSAAPFSAQSNFGVSVTPTGVVATSALGSFFSTITGLEMTSHVGIPDVQGDANHETASFLLSTSLGDYFTTNMAVPIATTGVGTVSVNGGAIAFISGVGIGLTSSIGTLDSVTGDANVEPQGLEAVMALGDYFIPLTGVQGDTVIADVLTTNMGIQADTFVGNTFESLASTALASTIGNLQSVSGGATATITDPFPVGMTGTCGAILEVIGDANVYLIGIEAVTSMGIPFAWGDTLPSQTPNFTPITPSQTPTFVDANPLQEPNWSNSV